MTVSAESSAAAPARATAEGRRRRELVLATATVKLHRGERLSEEQLKAMMVDEFIRAWRKIKTENKGDPTRMARDVLKEAYAISYVHVRKRWALEDRIAALEAKLAARGIEAKPRVRVPAVSRPRLALA